MTALPVLAVLASLLILTTAALAILRVDKGWRRQIRRCCRCNHTWTGLDKLCDRCQARGQVARDDPPHRVPDHDWQGHMDTGPIRVVPAHDDAREAA